MINIKMFEDYADAAKEAIEAAEKRGFTREEAMELLKIYEIWGLNDSIGSIS